MKTAAATFPQGHESTKTAYPVVDTAAAIRCDEERLRRNPNMTPARDWLKRLKDGDDPAHLAGAAIEPRRRSRR